HGDGAHRALGLRRLSPLRPAVRRTRRRIAERRRGAQSDAAPDGGGGAGADPGRQRRGVWPPERREGSGRLRRPRLRDGARPSRHPPGDDRHARTGRPRRDRAWARIPTVGV
ncbi:MAG: Anhydro-N-acetylmuramic acid kinase, partial [uncultured Thermomicrobiales bacterium]